VWFDEFELEIGDSPRREAASVSEGLGAQLAELRPACLYQAVPGAVDFEQSRTARDRVSRLCWYQHAVAHR
jgi:hypothetical protein